MSTTATSSPQAASLSRLERLKVNLGLKHLSQAGPSRQPRRYTDANESEWYIPYNGPYEQPKEAGMGRVRDRNTWVDLVAGGERVYDPFERDRTASGQGGTSTSGHGHGHMHGSSAHGHVSSMYYDEEREKGRGLGRQISPASNYSESGAILGGGERRSQVVAFPTTSPISPRRQPLPAFLDLDAIGIGIGESPVPMQRVGRSSSSGHVHDPHEHAQPHAWPSSAPAPVASTRDSVGSFWTFGRSSSKKNSPINAGGGRTSAESRPSTSTRQTASQGPVVMRDRSATVTGKIGEPFDPRSMRPRANTAVAPAAPAPEASIFRVASNQPVFHREYVDDGPELSRTDSPYQRHPYATAVSPTGHRQHSQLMPLADPKRDTPRRRAPSRNLNVPFLSTSRSFASLRDTARNLKTSVSTPNLRGEKSRGAQASGGSSVNSPGTQSASSTGTKWLSPETWCDALLFPRPRFRMRTAHIISPPTSPVGGNPPYSAPAQTQCQSGSLKKSPGDGRSPADVQKDSQIPSTTPPIVPYSNPEPPRPTPSTTQTKASPPQKTLHPPRPKSFAQDDLALPSPVPSLATVLRQNEEFGKERDQWKARATRSFGNKRSRSFSRSRMKARAKLDGKAAESESELAFSFDIIAASAFHGSQTAMPSIRFAQSAEGTGTRSGLGTNTTSSGLNSTTTHSRNTSNASKGGSGTSRSNGHGHARKESWSKSALKTAKQTANATGLCTFSDDLSPADEKIMALDDRLQQDRTRYLHLNPHEEKQVDDGDNVVFITAQPSHYLSTPQTDAGGPALSPVPSNRSGESTSHSGVGIALSTPTVLDDQPFQFSDHPYATEPNQNNMVPRPAEYAGPHPSRMAEFVLNESSLNDLSSRHRIPAAASRLYAESPLPHPYAAVETRSRPTLRVPTSIIPPPAKMFADVGTGSIREVLPDDIQYSPYSAQYSEGSNRNSEALGVEEALSLAFSHAGVDKRQVEGQSGSDANETEDFRSRIGVQELIAPPILRSAAEYRDALMPQMDEGSVRESWQNSQDDIGNGNFLVPTPMSTISYKANRSPGQMSLDSSPMASPRQLKKFDDMEDYSDLFYRPGQTATASGGAKASGSGSGSSGEPTPPNATPRALDLREEESGSPQRPMLTRSNSALTNLRRKLSEQYEANIEDHHVVGGDTGLRRHVSELTEVDEDVDDVHALLSQGSPPRASLPLRLQMTRSESPGPAHAIPEDVESSRASSILERYETEEGTEIYYRLGEVPALATPDPVTSANAFRASAHGSYIDNTPQSNPRSLSPDDRRQTDHSSHPSHLQPLSATSTTRGSYMTSTSSASRISQLSEFPVPPGQTTLTPGAIIQSYFGNTPEATERGDPLKGSEPPERVQQGRSRRNTFGPVSEDES